MQIDYQEQLSQLADYICQAQVIVFYGGAGTSTESGIADYRSKHGVWTAMEKEGIDPIKYANPKYIRAHPADFFRRRRAEALATPPQANIGHRVLAQWEKDKKDIRVITQNVDGLHQQAGHRFVLELHGHTRRWHCMDCGREYQPDELSLDEEGVPRCYLCQGIVRPNVVYFGENASKDIKDRSKQSLQEADLLIIAGTSLTTPLARRLVQSYQGDDVVVINLEPLSIQPLSVDLFIQKEVGQVLADVDRYMKQAQR